MRRTESKSTSGSAPHEGPRPLKVIVQAVSEAESEFYGPQRSTSKRVSPQTRVEVTTAAGLPQGIPPTPGHDLKFRGGKTIRALTYVNIYVAGDGGWNAADRQKIDRALDAAMTDRALNAVVQQYFDGQPITAQRGASHSLSIDPPDVVSRGDVDQLIRLAENAGFLTGDLETTVFNFLLPPGTVLTDDDSATGNVPAAAGADAGGRPLREASRRPRGRDGGDHPLAHDPNDKDSSLEGLGGYHGSVHMGNRRVYFAVGVFSERTGTGNNGIVAFNEPWKNVVATFYHELQEARTDPDVEDAIRTNNSRFIGWNSRQGEEIGDFPVFEAGNRVFVEVPVAGAGTAPVQLMYSNRVHGPEGP